MAEEPYKRRGRLADRLDCLFRTVHPKDRGPYTPAEVAEAVNQAAGERVISSTYVWQLRTGRRDNPTQKHLSALAAFFGVSPMYFFKEIRGGPRRRPAGTGRRSTERRCPGRGLARRRTVGAVTAGHQGHDRKRAGNRRPCCGRPSKPVRQQRLRKLTYGSGRDRLTNLINFSSNCVTSIYISTSQSRAPLPCPISKGASPCPAAGPRPNLHTTLANAACAGHSRHRPHVGCPRALRGCDPELFFPPGDDPAIEARHICATCPVRGQCLAYAVTADEPFGIWGGLDPHERQIMRRQIRAARTVCDLTRWKRSVTPEQRRLRARIAANARWSRPMARSDQAMAARAAMSPVWSGRSIPPTHFRQRSEPPSYSPRADGSAPN